MPRRLIERTARSAVTEALADTRVVFIMGARQVGKSTLATEVARSERPAPIVTLDNKASRDAAEADPTGFVAGLPRPAVVDEVQRAPELLWPSRKQSIETLAPASSSSLAPRMF